jgi:hypothetical protein
VCVCKTKRTPVSSEHMGGISEKGDRHYLDVERTDG